MQIKNKLKPLKQPQMYESVQKLLIFPQTIKKMKYNHQEIVKNRKNHSKIKSVGDLNQYWLLLNQPILIGQQKYFQNKNYYYQSQQDDNQKNQTQTYRNSALQISMINNLIITIPSYKKCSLTTAQTNSYNSIPNKLINYQFNEQNSIISFFNGQKKLLSIEDFDIMNLCGQGVYGSVFKAKHLPSNCIFALKKIDKSSLIDQIEIQALINQAKIHNKLNHPNIVKFYDVFSNENSVYYIIELCDDGNLYELLKKKKRFQQKQIRKITYQICKALNYLHERNIIHRDIKAQNIVMHQNVAKICDFGWAIEGQMSKKFLCGTPAYISPQIIQQKLYDKKVDVWSMGILIFELIYGHLPFQIQSQNDLQKIVTDGLKFPQQIQISQNCKDFIQKCLRKQAKQRLDTDILLNHPFLQRSS